MAKMRIRKGDTVLVISGKDKGLTGKVIAAYPETNRVIVEGINRIKKHTKVGQTARGTKTGGIITQEAPIDASTVQLVVEVNGQRVGTRTGVRVDEHGNRLRVSRRTGEDI